MTSESKDEVMVAFMVTVQHDHGEARKEVELASCPAAAQDAAGPAVGAANNTPRQTL